jgi:ferredoxin-type protein NapF
MFLLRSEMRAPLPPSVAVGPGCLALNGVYCESCRDSCEPGALRFVLQQGAPPRPVFEPQICTRCGECAAACPVNAISVAPKESSHA